MATKNTKYPGNLIQGQTREYWINAAKQFKWPIKFEDLQILVPQTDLEEAENDLMVKHFRNAGWFIQSAIVEYTKPFVAPVSNGVPIFRQPVKIEDQVAESQFKIGDRFKIKSTECELRINHIESKKVYLEYTNRPNKPPLLSSEENLNRALSLGYWLKI